ncbi:amidohydrolase [Anaerosinus massiliensis]|uniref:amidohydrolase n=1 Tax=Massilibacillus massiliensis TaxID=1806837 RepID=UPI000A3DA6B3|nr:amidohydrolase [Massilibacillus massiliensis]
MMSVLDLDKKIKDLAENLTEQTVARRRDLHQHPETAWTEFRTASFVADQLTALGYEVSLGADVVDEAAMMGVPKGTVLAEHVERAISQGANPNWVEKMAGGKTGVVGVLKFAKPGPTVGLRFDMDSNDAIETEDENHRPRKDGFCSINKGAMHACGHDGHTAVGLAVAEILMQLKDELTGTVKLVFQPAEEGVRGAKAMVQKGIVDDVDYMLGAHFGFQMKKTGQLACNVTGFLATSKFDAEFTGLPAHAGAAPETGKNALLAAAAAALNLHAISRHSDGASRINVGILNAGSGRNVIPPNAILKLETRGATSKINEYMAAEAKRIIQAAAVMYDVDVKVTEMGGAAGGNNTVELADKITKVAQRLAIFHEIVPECNFGASEDFSYFMERVQQNGGQAAYMMVGADLAAGHHDSYFDFDEKALDLATKLITASAVDLLINK